MTDVILLVHHAWKESFEIVERNQKAIAERGWAPLNYILLDPPELIKSQHIINGVAVAYQHLDMTGDAQHYFYLLLMSIHSYYWDAEIPFPDSKEKAG